MQQKSTVGMGAGCCPVCLSEKSMVVGEKDRQGKPLKSLFCLGCGLLRVDPLPSEESLRHYYLEQYRLEYKGVLRPKTYHVIRAARAACERIGWLMRHLPKGGQWLDVGAGSGEFAYLLKRKGFDVLALEPNRGYGEYVRETLGLAVVHGFLEDLGERNGEFDGLSAFHMLEHHPDPVGALRNMRRLLRPNGLLAVEVPNATFEWTHPESRFHPAHLVHFNVDNLKMATAKAGFETVELRTSQDGGVLLGVFRSASEAVPIAEIGPEKIALCRAAEKRRSAWRYYSNPTIWSRTGVRLVKLAAERRMGKRCPSPERYLAGLALPDSRHQG